LQLLAKNVFGSSFGNGITSTVSSSHSTSVEECYRSLYSFSNEVATPTAISTEQGRASSPTSFPRPKKLKMRPAPKRPWNTLCHLRDRVLGVFSGFKNWALFSPPQSLVGLINASYAAKESMDSFTSNV
jgi:hypothetical protein